MTRADTRPGSDQVHGSRLRLVAAAAGGLTLGVIVVMIVGIVTIQSIGAVDGAVINLNNEVVAITDPQAPILQLGSIAALSSLITYLVVLGTLSWERGTRLSLILGFVVSVAALTTWSLLSTYQNPVVDEYGISAGWRGWIEQGGGSSAVHVVLLLALAGLWMPRLNIMKRQS